MNHYSKALRTQSRQQQARRTIINGLISANRGNPFWSKADAMQSLNLFRYNEARYADKAGV